MQHLRWRSFHVIICQVSIQKMESLLAQTTMDGQEWTLEIYTDWFKREVIPLATVSKQNFS